MRFGAVNPQNLRIFGAQPDQNLEQCDIENPRNLRIFSTVIYQNLQRSCAEYLGNSRYLTPKMFFKKPWYCIFILRQNGRIDIPFR